MVIALRLTDGSVFFFKCEFVVAFEGSLRIDIGSRSITYPIDDIVSYTIRVRSEF